MSMITSTKWVPRGAPAAYPQKYIVDDAELSRISNLAKLQLEEARQDLEAVQISNDIKNDKATNGDHDMDKRSESSLSQEYAHDRPSRNNDP